MVEKERRREQRNKSLQKQTVHFQLTTDKRDNKNVVQRQNVRFTWKIGAKIRVGGIIYALSNILVYTVVSPDIFAEFNNASVFKSGFTHYE